MRRELAQILQLEVVLQAWTAWTAWNRLNEVVKGEWVVELYHDVVDARTREGTEALAKQAIVWECVRSILTAAAAVSRLKETLEKQGEQMVSRVSDPAGNEFESRELRNAFEHVETHLPRWLDENRDLLDSGKVALIGWGGTEPAGSRCFRYLNTKSWEIRVGNRRANLGKMIESLTSATRGGQIKLEWSGTSHR